MAPRRCLMALVLLANLGLLTACGAATAANDQPGRSPATVSGPISPASAGPGGDYCPPRYLPALPKDLNLCGEPVPLADPLVAEAEEEVSKLEQELDITIDLPEDFLITRSVLVEGYMAQIEFTFAEENYTGRYAKGQQENMSGFSKGFAHEETATIDGVAVKLRWTAKADIMSEVETTIGVADAYDQAKDLSYMVVLTKDSTKEKLVDAITAFMQAASQGAPEEIVEQTQPEGAAEAPAGESPEPRG